MQDEGRESVQSPMLAGGFAGRARSGAQVQGLMFTPTLDVGVQVQSAKYEDSRLKMMILADTIIKQVESRTTTRTIAPGRVPSPCAPKAFGVIWNHRGKAPSRQTLPAQSMTIRSILKRGLDSARLGGNCSLRACLETTSGPAAGDFGCGQGGEFRASPQWAIRNEPTQATATRPAARRVFAPKAAWLRCSSVEDPQGVFSSARAEALAPRHPAFGPKTGPLVVSKQALIPTSCHRLPLGTAVLIIKIFFGCVGRRLARDWLVGLKKHLKTAADTSIHVRKTFLINIKSGIGSASQRWRGRIRSAVVGCRKRGSVAFAPAVHTGCGCGRSGVANFGGYLRIFALVLEIFFLWPAQIFGVGRCYKWRAT